MIDDPPRSKLHLRPPLTDSEWDRYFDLRWRVLRAPWNQPRGSERDDFEAASIHVALWDEAGAPHAVGRLQLNSATEAQVRYMAVESAAARQGLGGRILAELERQARHSGAKLIVLNARKDVQDFYLRHGFEVTSPAPTLFGSILHVRMEKQL
jgi:predicted GNAT family N-acyltransferase